MQSLDEHTKVAPTKRYQDLVSFSASITSSPEVKNGFSEWQLSISPHPLKVEGRKLGPENIFTGGPKTISAGPRAEWNNRDIVSPKTVSKCVFVYPSNCRNEAKELMRQIDSYARTFKMKFAPPKEICIANDYPNTYVNAISDAVVSDTNMVICMLTRKSNGYDQIKVLCCKTLGVPSQCVMSKSMKNPKRLASISSKIIQQINCKVGGELWHVQVSFIVFLLLFFNFIFFFLDTVTKYDDCWY